MAPAATSRVVDGGGGEGGGTGGSVSGVGGSIGDAADPAAAPRAAAAAVRVAAAAAASVAASRARRDGAARAAARRGGAARAAARPGAAARAAARPGAAAPAAARRVAAAPAGDHVLVEARDLQQRHRRQLQQPRGLPGSGLLRRHALRAARPGDLQQQPRRRRRRPHRLRRSGLHEQPVLQADDGHGDLQQRRRRQQQQPRRLRRPAVHHLPRTAWRSSCTVDVDFGTIAAHGATCRALDGHDERDRQLRDLRAVRAAAVGSGRFQLDTTADVRVDFMQGTTSAHVVGLFRAGANQRCDRNPVDTCIPAGDDPTATPHVPGAGAGRLLRHRRVVPEPARPHDGDALHRNDRDAGDLRQRQGRRPERPDRLPGRRVQERRVLRRQRVHPRRQPGHAGGRRPERTVAREPGGREQRLPVRPARPACRAATSRSRSRWPRRPGLEVEFQQSGRSIFALYRMPGPGLACDADQRSCAFEDEAANAVAFVSLSAGRYLFIVKAQSGRAGTINLRLSAFSGTRGVEICGNGIDDDTNGLTDCDDPDCFGVAGCPAPACMPDQDLGSFSWGTRKTVTVDTRDGGTLYPTSCSRGTGKERVLRVNLTQPMSLGARLHRQRLARARAGPAGAAARRLRRATSSSASTRRCCRSGAATRSPSCSPARTTSSSRRSRRAARASST